MRNRKLILIGGSAGSFKVVNRIIPAIPVDFKHYVVFCLHRLRNIRKGFVEALSVNSELPIKEPLDKESLLTGILYIASSNYHLMTDHDFRFSLSVEENVNHSRPSIDILFETAAEVYKERSMGILLSGANSDGVKGMWKIKCAGGITIVQDPDDCEIPVMPSACLKLFNPDYIMNAGKIINFISNL